MSQDKEQLQALLADYVEGSLSERQIDEAEAYLAANPGVRTVVDRLMIDSEALRALPRQRATIDFSEDFRAQAERDLLLGDSTSATGRASRSIGGPMVALAAMLAVGLGLGGAAYYLLAYRPTTNLDYASVAAGRAGVPEPTTMPEPTTAPARASEPSTDREAMADGLVIGAMGGGGGGGAKDDGSAWDRAFAPGASRGAPAASIAPLPPDASPSLAPLTMAKASAPQGAVGRGREPARGTLVIVVDDASTLEATRDLVRAAIGEPATGNATSNNVATSAQASVESSTTAPTTMADAIARDVPATTAARLRVLFDGGASGARVYDVATTMPVSDAMQQTSGVARDASSNAAVDVYVVTRSSATTQAIGR